MKPAEMLAALDVLAEHVGKSIVRLDNQADEIAHQRMDLSMLSQHVDNLRGQVQAVVLESERYKGPERRNIDTRGLMGRLAESALRKAFEKAGAE